MSNTSGVTATKLIDKLVQNGAVTMEDIDAVYHRRLQASKEEIYLACEGFIDDHQKYLLQLIQKDIDQTQKLIDELSERIKNLLAPYDNAVERLKEIPGLSTKFVEDLIAEIGLDMEVFPTEKNLASWAGMSPGNNESAGKKKFSHQPRKQAGQIDNDRSRLGRYKNKRHIL